MFSLLNFFNTHPTLPSHANDFASNIIGDTLQGVMYVERHSFDTRQGYNDDHFGVVYALADREHTYRLTVTSEKILTHTAQRG